MNGIKKACQKRPVSPKVMEDLAEKIVDAATTKYEREIPSDFIGKMVMDGLSEIDEVAYVRFASVYRDFKDVREFEKELEQLLNTRDTSKTGKR